jgi:diguanylate cyclase
MAGLSVFPHTSVVAGAPALSSDLLAIVVAIVAFIVSGVFLLVLVPDRTRAVVAPTLVAVPASAAAPAAVDGSAPINDHGLHKAHTARSAAPALPGGVPRTSFPSSATA